MPPTVPINHHRLGEKKKIAFSLLFCFLLTPENQTKFVRDPTWPCSIIPCWSMQGIPQPLTVGFDLLWTLCFAQGKRTGALQKTKGEKKKREKSKLSLQIFQLWNPFVQTFLQKPCRKTRFEVQKRTLSKESTRASSRIIQTAMTFKEEPLRSWQPEKRRRDQCETESKPDCIFCGKPFCFLRGDNLRRESVKRKKKKRTILQPKSCFLFCRPAPDVPRETKLSLLLCSQTEPSPFRLEIQLRAFLLQQF